MKLVVGFIPLLDCASLVVAAERGFVAEEGLDLRLVRETSWANIRDRVIVGHFDAAHMLAPMAIASTLGLKPSPTPTQTSPIRGWSTLPYFAKETIGVGLGRIIGYQYLGPLHGLIGSVTFGTG